MSERKYYCYCEDNCRFETMTKEQILAAIAQATGVQDVDPDAGFISKVKETNSGQFVTFWVGTQAQYNKIEEKTKNCLYIIADDTSKEDFERFAKEMRAFCEAAVENSAEAKGIATQALSIAGVKRTENRVLDDLDAVSSVTVTEDKNALFYILEIINREDINANERYTVTLDYYQVRSGMLYAIPSIENMVIKGTVENNQVTISVLNIGTENFAGYKITRCVAYGSAANNPLKHYASEVISIAEAEVGYLEKASNSLLDSKTANAGSANYTKYARDLDAISGFYNGAKQGFAWCDVFVDWCFVQAFGVDAAKTLLCQPNNSLGAGCDFSAGYYRNNGQFYTSNPQIGDQIFFGTEGSEQHTGIVYNVDSEKVYTIEGNSSNSVAKREYSLDDEEIAGYGRPKYDTV